MNTTKSGLPSLLMKSGALVAVCALAPMARAVAMEAESSIVTTKADVVADDGVRSLREAIDYANAHAGTTIGFNLPANQAVGGVFTLAPTSALPWIAKAGTIIDGASQTRATGNTNAAGPEIEISGAGVSGTSPVIGLVISSAPNCVVNNVIINSFSGTGLQIQNAGATGTRVVGCYIGINAAGTTAKPNGGSGLALRTGAVGSIIGDATVTGRNVIAGNTSTNFTISGVGADNNLVRGNYIGVNAGGNARLGDRVGLLIGSGAKNNTIGGTSAGSGNVIVGASANLQIQSVGTSSNVVQGNFIGTDKSGMTPLHNAGYSILITGGADYNLIGGTNVAARNVISNGTSCSLSGSSGKFWDIWN